MTDTFTRSTGAPGALRLRCVRQNPQTNGTISFWKDPSAAPESIATAIRRLFSSIHATIPFSRRRTRNGAFRRLEPYAGKPARTVLRGERGSNAADLLDFIHYTNDTENSPISDAPLGARLLKRGMSGKDVRTLQEFLMQLGYDLPLYGADGDFGWETEAAVMAFQAAADLQSDGKYGEKTHAALMDSLEGEDAADPEVPFTAQTPRLTIISNGGNVNIRSGNGTAYAKITSVAPGTTLEHVATAKNHWHAVVINGLVGWVSGDYARLEEIT